MLTIREECEIIRLREIHLVCLLGWITAAFATLVFAAIALFAGSRWACHLAVAELLVGIFFFVLSRAPLRRIRELEQFEE